MSNAVLRILDLMQGVFRWLGADYDILRTIVEVKFKMQNRRPMASFSHYKSYNSDQNTNNSFWIMVGLFSIIGGAMGLTIFFIDKPYYAYALPFGYIMIMSVLTLVTDFSSLLLDTTDNVVLLPRPVTGRTILLARLVHIASYVLILSYGIALLPLIFTLFKYGILAFLAFALAVFVLAMLSVFFTSLLYMLLMRFTSEERLKDIISYFQIAFTLLVTAGYQMVGRIFTWLDLDTTAVVIRGWHYALPPLWLSGWMQFVIKSAPQFWALSLLAFVIPLASAWILIRFLAPKFTQQIAQLGTGDGGGAEKTITQKRHGFVSRLATFVTGSSLEKAIFELSWKITARDRKFKMRTYPTFGSLIPLVFVFGKGIFDLQKWSEMAEGYLYLMLLYMAHIIAATFQSQSHFSEDFKAAWVYFATPTDSPRDVVVGNIKAILLKFYTPFYLLLSAFVLSIWGIKALDDLYLAFVASVCLSMIESKIGSQNRLPFSKSLATMKEAGQTSQFVIFMLLLPICGFGHWGLTFIPFGVPIACVFATFIAYVLYKQFDKLTWESFDL